MNKERIIKILTFITNVLVALYLGLFHILSISQSINKICLLFMFLICLLTFLKRERFIIPKEFLFLSAFYVFALLSLLWSPEPSVGYRLCFRTIPLLLVMTLLLYNFVRQNKNPEVLVCAIYMTGIVLTVAMVVVYGGFRSLVGFMKTGLRLGGLINNENDVGMGLAMASVVAFYLFLNSRWWHSVFSFVFAVMAMATGSRKVVLILVLGGFLTVVSLLDFSKGKGKKNCAIIGGAIAFVGVCFALMFKISAFSSIKSRFLTMLSSLSNKVGGDGSTDTRMEMIKVGWEAFKSHPFGGVGVGTSSLLGFGTYLHNNFIEILASLGGVGFFLYYASYGVSFLRTFPLFKNYNRMAFLAAIINICWLVVQVGLVSYETKDTYYYLVLLSVLSGIQRDDMENEKQNKVKRSFVLVD